MLAEFEVDLQITENSVDQMSTKLVPALWSVSFLEADLTNLKCSLNGETLEDFHLFYTKRNG